MVRNKLAKFAEMQHFSNVFQPSLLTNSFEYKGRWNEVVFNNNHPLVLELGCGKGEYTLGLARQFKEKNFIGIDIKGARMYFGAKQALQEQLTNVAFLRIRIELIENFFNKGEVDEIWLTFPDPQPKKRWTKKRLTSAIFLNKYQQISKPGSIIHLKTDSLFLYYYTLTLLQKNNIEILAQTNNLYQSEYLQFTHGIKTHYETQFLEQGLVITYLQWKLPEYSIIELDDETYQKIEEQYL